MDRDRHGVCSVAGNFARMHGDPLANTSMESAASWGT